MKLFILFSAIFVTGCSKTNSPPYPDSVTKYSGYLVAAYAGTFSTAKAELLDLRAGCFTCEKYSVTVETCSAWNTTTLTCTASTTDSKYLKINFPASMPSGSYQLTFGEGAVNGYVESTTSTLYGGSSNTNKNQDSPPGIFTFTYP